MLGGTQPIPDDVLLSPKWLLQLESKSGLDPSTASPDGVIRDSNAEAENDEVDKSVSTCGYGPRMGLPQLPTRLPSEDILPIDGALAITLLDNSRVTPESHWQDVRHLRFAVKERLSYVPGDVLTIYPKNFPDEVDEFITLMGWASVADQPIKLARDETSEKTNNDQPPIKHVLTQPRLTLRTLLESYLDIMSIPRRSFFSLIANFTDNEYHKQRLIDFTIPDYLDELYDYTTRPRRSILEVLQEFDSVKIPWPWAAHVLPSLRPRQFSIASGGHLTTASPDGESRVELLVAIVKYRTVIKRVRQGVCTRYLASLQPGQRVTGTVQKGGLNFTTEEKRNPVVMIGPGTGVAPMRALAYERLAAAQTACGQGEERKAAPLSGDVLFFGCRNQQADYFFRDEWELLERNHGLKVFAAFSRDQVKKNPPAVVPS